MQTTYQIKNKLYHTIKYILATIMLPNNKSPTRPLVNKPSSKDVTHESENSKPNNFDPFHQLDIVEFLRKEVQEGKSELTQKNAEIERLRSQNIRLQSSHSLSEKMEDVNRKRQELQDELKKALADSQKRYNADIQKFKLECSTKMAEKPILQDFSIQRQSSNTAETEIKVLKEQLRLLTEQYKEAQKRLAESKSGSQSSRELESSFTELTKKIDGYKRQMTDKDEQNRRLQDQISTLRKKAGNVEGDIAAKNAAIKRLSTFIKRNWMTLQSQVLKDQRLPNPAKSISDGSDIQEAKLKELEKYQATFLKAIKVKVDEYAKNEASYLTTITSLGDQKDRIAAQSTQRQLDLKQDNSRLSNRLAVLQKGKTKAQEDNQKLDSKIAAVQRQNANQRSSIAQLEKQKKDFQDTIKSLNDKNIALDKQVKNFEADLRQTKLDLTQKTSQLESAKKSITTLTSEKKTLTENLSKTTSDLSTANATIATNKNRITALEQSQKRLTSEVRTLQETVRKLTTDKNRLDDDVRKKNQDIDAFKGRLSNLESDITSLNYNLNKEKDDHKRSLGVINNINKMMIAEASQHFTGKTKLLQRTNPNENDKLQKEIQGILNEWVSSFRAAQFFNGSAIIPRESVSWMVDTLRNYMKQVPTATRLVHRFDPLNSTNFHQYIDAVPNLLVLIHLSNGAKIGGFTAYPVLKDHIQEPGKGFIFSITDSKAYYMRKQPRKAVVNYDEYYLILGNADIRLRQQKQQQKQMAFIFSSFGISSSTFDNQGDSRTKFLKISENTNNDQPVDSFEFYEVIFER